MQQSMTHLLHLYYNNDESLSTILQNAPCFFPEANTFNAFCFLSFGSPISLSLAMSPVQLLLNTSILNDTMGTLSLAANFWLLYTAYNL